MKVCFIVKEFPPKGVLKVKLGVFIVIVYFVLRMKCVVYMPIVNMLDWTISCI